MPTPHPLAPSSRAALAAFFAARNHHPSADHWAALDDVLGTLDAMAAGTAAPTVFVGALDPGVGKSTAVLEFARALMASPEHQGVGMVICVGRIEEAKTIARALAEPGASLAVLTSNDEANALSTVEPGAAQVLITTQQRVEALAERRSFAGVEAFHYRGAVRRVRVWDEAWMPGAAVTVTSDDIAGVRGAVRERSDPAAQALRRFELALDDKADGAAVHVPDFEGEHGFTFLEVIMDLEAAGKPRDDLKAILGALRAMNGKTAQVKKEGKGGGTVLTFQETLPEDLVPLLVLDASARVRTAYRMISDHRGGVTWLREAVKDYAPLTVHLWDTSGSKSGWEKQGAELVKGIVETVRERPEEPWLIVHHKRPARKGGDVVAAIRKAVGPDVAARVSFVSWGNHMASNDYVEVPNVILAGTLFMRPSHYLAQTHMAQGLAVADGVAPADDVKSVTQGEHANVILQAVCRGRVRKSDGPMCQPMNAYVIASKRSGIGDVLPTVFPGCAMKAWMDPKAPRITGKLAEALRFIDTELKAGHQSITYKAIVSRLKIKRQNLGPLVTKKAEWGAELLKRGLETFGRPGMPGGVRVAQGEA